MMESGWEALEFSNGLLSMLDSAAGRLPLIHATLDDFGDCKTDGMSAVAGYVAYREQWGDFNWAWKKTLGDFGLEYLHTSNYIFKYLNAADHGPTDEEIFKTLDPFIDIIHRYLIEPQPHTGLQGLGICVIVKCADYEQLTVKEKKFVREPEVTSFELAVGLAAWHVRGELSSENGMAVQIDESQNACKLYERYQALKRENETLKKYLGAICFADDKRHYPVQAADLLSHLTLRAWRAQQSGKPWPQAFYRLVYPSGQASITSRVFGTDRLKKLAKIRMDLNNKMAIPDGSEIL